VGAGVMGVEEAREWFGVE